MPTQCTKTSSPPRRSRASATAARACAGSLRSAACVVCTRASARWSASWLRSTTPTDAPASRKPSTSAAPIVPAPPATSTRRPPKPSQSTGTGRRLAVREDVEAHRGPLGGNRRRVRGAARERGQLAGAQPDRLARDDEVDRTLEDLCDLVLGMAVLLPARARAVAVQRGGQLRSVDGGAEDPGTHLGELLLLPVDRPRRVHSASIAYSLWFRPQ